MEKIHQFKIYFSIIIASLFVTLGFEIEKIWISQKTAGEANSYFSIGVLIISFILSTISVNYISGLLIERRWFRKIIYKNEEIEGFWLLQTFHSDSNKEVASLFKNTGIAQILFRGSKSGFQTIASRAIEKDGKIIEYYTKSKYTIFDYRNLSYLNYVKVGEARGLGEALAYGDFFSSPGSDIVDTYDGIIIVFNGEAPLRQKGRKIPLTTIKKYKKEHKNNWKNELIKEFSTAANNG